MSTTPASVSHPDAGMAVSGSIGVPGMPKHYLHVPLSVPGSNQKESTPRNRSIILRGVSLVGGANDSVSRSFGVPDKYQLRGSLSSTRSNHRELTLDRQLTVRRGDSQVGANNHFVSQNFGTSDTSQLHTPVSLLPCNQTEPTLLNIGQSVVLRGVSRVYTNDSVFRSFDAARKQEADVKPPSLRPAKATSGRKERTRYSRPRRASRVGSDTTDHLVLTTADLEECLVNRRTMTFDDVTSGIISAQNMSIRVTRNIQCTVEVLTPAGRVAAVHISSPRGLSTRFSYDLYNANGDTEYPLFKMKPKDYKPSPEVNLTIYTTTDYSIRFTQYMKYYRLYHDKVVGPVYFTVNFTIFPATHSALQARWSGPRSGFISTWNWDGVTSFHWALDASFTLTVPSGHDVMATVLDLFWKSYNWERCRDRSQLQVYADTDSEEAIKRYCRRGQAGPNRFNTTTTTGALVFRLHLAWKLSTGLNILFSFHPRSAMLTQSAGGAWNCSVPLWADFRPHFPCNLRSDCIDSEDEAECPYASADRCRKGWFAIANSCYTFVRPANDQLQTLGSNGANFWQNLSWPALERGCRDEGGHMVSLNSYRETLDVVGLLHRWDRSTLEVVIGMMPAPASLPFIYRHMWVNMDDTVNHFNKIDAAEKTQHSCSGALSSAVLIYYEAVLKLYNKFQYEHYVPRKKIIKSDLRLCKLFGDSALCEMPARMPTTVSSDGAPSPNTEVLPPRLPRPESKSCLPTRTGAGLASYPSSSFVQCPAGHVTHNFLACDIPSSCWGSTDSSSDSVPCRAPMTPLPPSMTCDEGEMRVPYTLVCDYRADCEDESDETFCVFKPCDVTTHFMCTNKECLPRSMFCDGISHCHDNNDEIGCYEGIASKKTDTGSPLLPPALLVFDGRGATNVWALNQTLHFNDIPVSGRLTNGRLDRVTLAGGTFVNHTVLRSKELIYGRLIQADKVSGTLCSGIVTDGHLLSGTVVSETTGDQTQVAEEDKVTGIVVSGVLVNAKRGEGLLYHGTLINVTMVSGVAECPASHFQCRDGGYCLPVFTRCNRVNDCPGREDEVGCDSGYQCPGLYRCRGSTMCVGEHDMCDGVRHCPRGDDELLCDAACSHGCTCYGLAFFCSRATSVAHHPELRFLDASHSGMGYRDVVNNTMLIHLSLARCEVDGWGQVILPNLRILDLDSNNFTKISSRLLLNLPNLQRLTLANNPLTSDFLSEVTSLGSFLSLKSLDMSGTYMPELNVTTLSVFFRLDTLNLSGSKLDSVLGEGFPPLKHLRELDMRACPVTYFPKAVFHELGQLRTVSADNYKLCCPQTLPAAFYITNCHAPSDEVSSCEALLRTNPYRICLYIIAALSCVGNLSSLAFRVKLNRRKQMSGFQILVFNLCASDLFMGVYLAIIGAADRYYMGAYLWNDVSWRYSAACKIAGVLSLLSSEVSAFVICLITLDRLLVLRFPFRQIRFNRLTASLASLLIWAICLLIAAIPLSPAKSHWQFYSQTAICIPLPITRTDFKGHDYSFLVMIVLNFALFVMVALGQLLIYMSVQRHKMPTIGGDKTASVFNNDQTLARRLITVAASDFLCWFPIGVVGMMAASGYDVPGEINVAMAIFVLPINSAINPFLYTLNILLEKHRQARERRMKQFLLSQINAQGASSGGVAHFGSSCTQHEAQVLVKLWLKRGILAREHISVFLGETDVPTLPTDKTY